MKKKINKKIDWKRAISICVLYSFIIPIGFIIYKIIISPTTNETGELGVRLKTDYILMLLQCIVGILAMLLPSAITKKKKIVIPSNMYLAFVIFLYAAIFLGEVRNFYYDVPQWDTILHTFSGAMLGALGFSFINILNNENTAYMHLSPIFVAIFSFCFAVTLGALWEIYEFSFDGLLGLNMQKFALENHVALVGREALKDTMKDIIVDCLGAFTVSLIGYISLRYKKGWYENFLIKIPKDNN